MKHCGAPAAYVVRDLEGLEWFVCAAHGDPFVTARELCASPPEGAARWITRTPIAEWFAARAMPVPMGGRVCNEASANDPTTRAAAAVLAAAAAAPDCLCGPEWRNPNCDVHGNAHMECVDTAAAATEGGK